MYAVVLCAGLGTRLSPITNVYAKPSIQVIDRPLLEWTIDNLVLSGIYNIVITTFHRAESIEKLNLAHKYKDCNIQILRENYLLGTGGGIRNAILSYGLDDLLVVVNGDSLWDFDLRHSIENHISRKNYLTLLLVCAKQGYTPIQVDDQNRVFDIGRIQKNVQSFTYSGISILSRESQRRILLEEKPYFFDDFIIPWVNEKNIYGDVVDGFWADLGTLETHIPHPNQCLDSNF